MKKKNLPPVFFFLMGGPNILPWGSWLREVEKKMLELFENGAPIMQD